MYVRMYMCVLNSVGKVTLEMIYVTDYKLPYLKSNK